MNVLFLTLVKIMEFDQPCIYTDLLNEFARRKHKIYIVAPVEKKDFIETRKRERGNITLLQVKIGNYFNVGTIEKGLTLLELENAYLKAIRSHLTNTKFDLVLYSTPPITFGKVIKYIKQRDGAKTYLMLKDIFPQNAVDIDLMSRTGIIYQYFRNKEKKLYQYSDFIGCMSNANIQYILNNNQNIDKAKVELCPNCMSVDERDNSTSDNVTRKIFELPQDDTIFLYGGNLGAPQGIEFIIECLKENEKKHKGYFVIIGQGSHYDLLDRWFKATNPKYSKLLNYLPREQYNKLVHLCDVGLVFLDHRFTIPNFPSRILSYMIAKLPVLAATDPNTDLGDAIQEGKFGKWCESNDVNGFITAMDSFRNKEDRIKMGNNGYAYLLKNYTSEKAYKTIINHFDKENRN